MLSSMKAENFEQSFALEEMREIISHLTDVFTALNQSGFPIHWWTGIYKKTLVFLQAGFKTTSPRSNFVQTIPPATQAILALKRNDS